MSHSRMRARDLLEESVAGILQRPGRTALTVVGVAVGVAAFVAVLGLTATVAGQIGRHFTELSATEVTVQDVGATSPDAEGASFPGDADRRVLAISGAQHAGVLWAVPAERLGPVTGVPLPGVATNDRIPVMATSPGLFGAVRAHLRHGRAFDSALDARRERVAIVGSAVAGTLGVSRLEVRPVIFVGGVAFTVIGVVDDVQRRHELLTAVWVPRQTAELLWHGPPDTSHPPLMIIDTDLGAASVVAKLVPLALRPDAPAAFNASAHPDPRQLRDRVSTELSGLFLGLAAICLFVGAVGIANTSLVAVLERVPEIGLRRSIGAHRRHIAAQFLIESSTLGMIGGLTGASVGVSVVVGVAIFNAWTPILAAWTVLGAPLIGAGTGLVAGLHPAWRASRIEPADALRRQ